MSLPTLASIDDVTVRLGRPMTPVEIARAGVLLKDASAQIRRYCRKDFLYYAADTITAASQGAEIRLPGRPVLSVSSVTAISGRPDWPNIPVTWFSFDGIDRILITEANASGVINLPEAWYEYGAYPGTYIVVYEHGYQEYPDEVTMVCSNAVMSVLQAPTMAAGVIGETVGAYSYRLERGGGGLAVALSEADLAQLDDFRDKQGTMSIGQA
jgi:hypothetical protein